MNWIDYTITQAGPHFTIKGEWAGEVMGWSKEGKPDKTKENIPSSILTKCDPYSLYK